MAKWEVENPKTKEILTIEQDNPPTDAQLALMLGMAPPPAAPEASFLSKTGAFLKANMELPMGVSGSVAGAALGAPFGPPGMIAGGILGGALGSAGGSLSSDILQGRPLNMEEARKEAAISAGLDVATFGAGKLVKPVLRGLGVTLDDLYRTIRPRALPVPAGAPTVGTPESLLQTQALLSQGGGTLSATQTGRASSFRKLAEQLGDIGIFSGARARQRIAVNSSVLKEEVQRQIDGLDTSLTMGPAGLGESILDIVSSGRQANSAIYDRALTDITTQYGNKAAPVKNIFYELRRFRDAGVKEFGSIYSDATQRELGTLISSLDGLNTMPVSSLMAFQKKLNSTVSQMSDIKNASMYNGTAAAELAQLSEKVRNSVAGSLALVDEDLAKSFKVMNDTFGRGAENLLPKLTQGLVTRADRGSYETLGNLLLTSSSSTQISAMMSSVDEAFRLADKAGVPIQGAIDTAAKAKAAIRQSYIQNIFGEVQGSEDIYKAGFKNLADKFEKKAVSDPAVAVLGERYDDFKRLLNAISDSASKADSSLFGLMLRSKESSAAQGLLALGGAGVGSTLGLPAAAAVFAVPEVLSRVATNKAAVNRLLMLNRLTQQPNYAPEAAAVLMAKVFEALSSDDREAIKEHMQQQ